MSAAIQHILLTRFNVGLDARAPAGERWLRERVALFERYTVPSLRSQTRLPDCWLIYCDDGHGSPDWFREWAAGIKGLPIEWLWVGDVTPATWTRTVGARVDPSRDLLLTTRMDNDDALAPDFCERIRGAVAGPGEFLNPTFGLQWDGQHVYFRADPSGPFISYVEAIGDRPVTTVFAGQHDHAARRGPVRQVRTRPLWLQVLHGGNMANEVAGIAVPSGIAGARRFAMVEGAQTPSIRLVAGSAASLVRKVLGAVHRVRRLLDIARPAHGRSNG